MKEYVSLEPEVLCNFHVDSKAKLLWNYELELLELFKSVCSKYGLTWWVSGGTLLGAVRHEGFIPWDDDIDVCMPRKDFDILQRVASEEFSGKYYFQSGYTEEKCFRLNVKIRNTETDAYVLYEREYGETTGVFIDVFPMDNIPDSKIKEEIQKYKIFLLQPFYRFIHHPEHSQKGKLTVKLASTVYKTLGLFYTPVQVLKKIEKAATKYEDIPCKRFGMITFRPRDNGFKWEREWFKETVECAFEKTTVNIPKEYDKVLRQQYGDYTIIPENPPKSFHGQVIFNID